MMAGKYSAEWWEKIADINREISPRQDPSSVVDDLIQATASGQPSPTTTCENIRRIRRLEASFSRGISR
jgi:hypothetical protein